jgi:hypothetical protein
MKSWQCFPLFPQAPPIEMHGLRQSPGQKSLNISYGVKIEKAEKEKSDNQASDKAENQSSNQSKIAESEKQQSRQKVKIKR